MAAAGLVNPATGLALTANLPATGKPFPADIAAHALRSITYVNDCRAQALSEAQFGAAKGFRSTLSLNLGTGLAGGIVVEGRLLPGPSGLGGEFGHFALPAPSILAHNLPISCHAAVAVWAAQRRLLPAPASPESSPTPRAATIKPGTDRHAA